MSGSTARHLTRLPSPRFRRLAAGAALAATALLLWAVLAPQAAAEAPGAPSSLEVQRSADGTSATLHYGSGGGDPATYDWRRRERRNGPGAGYWVAWSAWTNTITDVHSVTDTGLNPTSTYLYQVRARNADGVSNPISAASFAAPRNLTATPGDRQIWLNWTAPPDPLHGTLTHYEWRWQENRNPRYEELFGPDWGWAEWQTLPAGQTTLHHYEYGWYRPLRNNSPHFYQIRAASGNSHGAIAMVSAHPNADPPIPVNVSAVPGDGQVTVSWNRPSDGGVVWGYEYERSWRVHQLEWVPWATEVIRIPGGGGVTSRIVTDLTNNVLYRFRIRAWNSAGISDWSAAVDVTPGVRVMNLTASREADATSTTLTWNPDASGTPSSYEWRRRPWFDTNTYGAWSAWTDTGSAATTLTDTGLTATSTYDYQVRAKTGAGVGPEAHTIAFAAPRNLTATSSHEKVTLNWALPPDPGHGAITGYQWRQRLSIGGSWGGWGWILPNQTWVVAGSLTNGFSYDFQLRAFNGSSSGAISAAVSAVPGLPNEPTGLTAGASGLTEVTLSWTAAAGAAEYEYRYKGNGHGYGSWTATGSADTSTTVTGLASGAGYYFQVRGKNSYGVGASSAEVYALVLTPPQNLRATVGASTVTLRWDHPPNSGIQHYQIRQVAGAGLPCWFGPCYIGWFSLGPQHSTHPHTVRNAFGSEPYGFEVRAVSHGGHGPAGRITVVTGAPAVTNLTVSRTEDGTAAVLTWHPGGGGTPTAYEWRRRERRAGPGSGYWLGWSAWTDADVATTHTDTSLNVTSTYMYQVRAKNDTGPSPEISAVAFAAPTNLTAVPGNAEATVSWTAPPDPGHGTLTHYHWRLNYGNGRVSDWRDLLSPNTTQTVRGLWNRALFRIELRAVNGGSYGAVSQFVAVRLNLPVTPTGLSAAGGDGRVVLSWTRSNSPIMSYQYRLNIFQDPTHEYFESLWGPWITIPGSSGTTASYTVPNLVNGTRYYVQIRTVYGSLQSAPTAAVNATPGVLSAVTNFTATRASASSAALAWTAGADGPPPSSYQWRRRERSGPGVGYWGNWSAWTDTGSTATSLTDSGLNAAATYMYQVLAKNAAGASPEISAVAFAAPRNLTATHNGSQITLSWAPPPDPMHGTLTGYQWRQKLSSSGSWSNWSYLQPHLTSHTIGNRTNTDYDLQVRAVSGNSAGDSAAVTAVGLGTLDSVTGFSATRSSATEVSLAWTASGIGPQPSSYEWRHRTWSGDGPWGDWSAWTNTGSAATYRFLSDLTAASTYEYQVRAKNAAGVGPASTAISLAAVRNLSATPGLQQITLNWTKPPGPQGTPTMYLWRQRPSSGGTWTTWGLIPSDRDWATASGLLNGVSYDYEIRAFSGNSAGTVATISSLTLVPPHSVTNFTATRASAASAELAWSAGGGGPPSSYTWRRRDWFDTGSWSGWSAWTDTGSTATALTDTGLTAAYTYEYQVRAKNAAGVAYEVGAVAFGAPRNVTATHNGSQITLSWTSPPDPGWGTLTGYQWRQKVSTSDSWSSWSPLQPHQTSHTVGNLTNADYDLQVRAVSGNSAGDSATVTAAGSGALESVTDFTAARASAASAELRWTEGSGGPRPSSFEWRSRAWSGNGPWSDWTAWSNTGNALTVRSYDGLAAGSTYEYQVRAKNAAGVGPASSAVAFGAPSNLTATSGNGLITLNWTVPPDPGSGTLTGYHWRQRLSGGDSWSGWGWVRPNQTWVVSGSLTNGVSYDLQLRALSGNSGGAISATVSATPGTPAVPAGLTATVSNAQISLSWNDPSDSSLTQYEYQQQAGSSGSWSDWTAIPGSGAGTTSYLVPSLSLGVDYSFRIRSTNQFGSSAASAVATAKIPHAPAAPTGLTATAADGEVTLNWVDPANSSITSYEYQQDGGSWVSISGSGTATTSHIVTGLTNGTQYSFKIRAVNASGNGAASEAVNATPTGGLGAAGA